MTVRQLAGKVWEHPFGRFLSLIVGAVLVARALTLYPQIVPAVKWVTPVGLVLWGVSRFYLFGVGNPLTSVAGCLLVLGGFTYASYMLVPMGEITGTMAQLVPIIGIFVNLFATHYRNQN